MPLWRRLPAALFGAALAIALASWSPLLSAQRENERPGPLLGGTPGAPKPPPALDPRLPKGPRRQAEPRPGAGMKVACGLRRNVCVHAGAEVSPPLHQAYVDALEEAWDRVVGALRLPAPLPDPGLGPTPGLDLYLLSQATEALETSADPRRQLADVSSGFCKARPLDGQRQRQTVLCVAEASLLGLDAAETPHVRRAIASELWLALGSTSAHDLSAIDDLQSNPQLGLVKRKRSAESSGAALWFRALNRRLAAGRPGRLPPALVQQSRGSTPPGSSEWHNEPDVLDVTRVAFESRGESFADFALDFAIERAFLGSRDAGDGDPALRWLGDAGRVRFDWVIPASTLPRRVAPRRPLEPLGSTYLWLALDRVTLGATLAFRAEWEGPVTFRWSLIAVDGAGRLLKRFDLPFVQNATSAERTLVDYDGAVGLLIVGTNLGGIDLAHPFDPDFEPFEPHGFTVYLTEL